MNILVTGGAGFLGARLVRALLGHASSPWTDSASALPVDRIVIADRVAPAADLARDPRVVCLEGDLLEQVQQKRLPLAECDLVFHLAAAVSGECEADMDLGLRSNVDTTRALLQSCRDAGHAPRLVFASSVAVFGFEADAPHVTVDDQTLPTPQNSYGIQKFICEQLVADFTRKGYVRGRSVRLMTVSVRPGRPNGAASSFLSGIVREPLAGQRAICPVAPETEIALASPGNAIRGLLRAAAAPDEAWKQRTALNLPALTTTVAEMVAALERVAGAATAGLIEWIPDSKVAEIVTRWPSRIRADRAASLGLGADPDFESILRKYLAESGGRTPSGGAA